MDWSWRQDEELREFWETWEQVEPSLERMFRQDQELDELVRRVESLEARVRELEGKPQPLPQFRTGKHNVLLNAVKESRR
jgi:cell division protein FtsB